MVAHSNISLERIYDANQLSLIDATKSPQHIAIIMDGNRRWARQRGLPPIAGHWEGAETLVRIVRCSAALGVKTLTVFSFSTENWERPDQEIDALMNIFELYLVNKREWMIREGVRLDAIGDLSRLPSPVKKALDATKMMTKDGDRINLVLAINYGARDEIRRAIVKILQQNEERKIAVGEITESFIEENLDTKTWGDPDLLIRTSGELRLSNFLLWQISYTELYMTETLWPDFSAQSFFEAVLSFQQRNRRRGGGV